VAAAPWTADTRAGYGEVRIAPREETVWRLTVRFVRAQLGETGGSREPPFGPSASGSVLLAVVAGAAGALFLLLRSRR
jgi:hypothetical protein